MKEQSEPSDWGALQIRGVAEVIEQAARRVNRQYGFTKVEDLEQDARIAVANTPNLLSCLEGTEPALGILQHRLVQDLTDRVKYEAKHREQTISYTKIQEDGEEGRTAPSGYVAVATASNAYNRESVETLLGAVWDDGFVYGLPVKDTAPDPDMPKGSINKSHGNDLSAYIADIKTGWKTAPLTQRERRAIVLRYGLDWTERSIAFNQECSRQAISTRLFTGIGKIVAELNGSDLSEFLEGNE